LILIAALLITPALLMAGLAGFMFPGYILDFFITRLGE
jgi:hypothetical protein